MKLSDLRVGDVVLFRDGCLYVVLSNPSDKTYGLALYNHIKAVAYLCEYNEDMIYTDCTNKTHLDILAVYKASEPHRWDGSIFTYHILSREASVSKFNSIEWDWKRENEFIFEQPKKEMTVAEIEKELGYKIKIV